MSDIHIQKIRSDTESHEMIDHTKSIKKEKKSNLATEVVCRSELYLYSLVPHCFMDIN